MSLDEVTRFFHGLTSLRHRAILMTAYAAGSRISEVLGVRVGDIDSRRMVIHLRQAKGSKDHRDRLESRIRAGACKLERTAVDSSSFAT